MRCTFEWDEKKNLTNQKKHGISFEEAQYAFADKKKIILFDLIHSKSEKRYFCIAQIKRGIITVRFTYRTKKLRIFGAAFWRAGRKKYLVR
ncbi:MAG: hypothetical protein COU66_03980 [Candidatus Pacebacteria bacterium CG10_big_fil_rev_8_21_14_0_10_44_11]|nr:MAG: hypothetical protein COU66_03980 [Candidatus Pacebacteria bacterium CG10_big_fil_rev_8_21_14_0_10_44_11]